MKKVLLTSLVAFGLTACAVAPSNVGPALVSMTKENQTATSNTGTRMGTACATNILGVYASGDNSIEAAKKAGGITSVATVDHERTNILYLFAKTCTIVTGK